MFDLSGRTALVTGAGQNIGAGIARGLAGQGAHVVVNGYFADRAQAVTDDINAAGGSAAARAFDVTDLDAVMAAVAEMGVVDILVNNAGLAGPTDMKTVQFRDMAPGEWQASDLLEWGQHPGPDGGVGCEDGDRLGSHAPCPPRCGSLIACPAGRRPLRRGSIEACIVS